MYVEVDFTLNIMKNSPFTYWLHCWSCSNCIPATVFTDVEESSWYYEAVQSLSEKGIIKGYENGSFKPSDNVNRAELAVTLDRLIEYLERLSMNIHYQN